MIPVTKSYFPPIEDYKVLLQRIYNNAWLTNRGDLVIDLEKKLCDYLRLKKTKILLTNNGTIPLQIALKLLGEEGEIITTPFSYVATTSAIVWENCNPVFVDIHPDYLTIDESKIEAAITEKTTCILATHVFGNPCNVEEIEKIAIKHQLKVIYDAAHCFGVNFKGKSIFEYGDLSTCSFHATKLFHTGEGGAAFCRDKELFQKVFYSHNFGHDGPLDFHGLGINGKMSELHAAMGLTVLQNMDYVIQNRRRVCEFYDANLNFNQFAKLTIRESVTWNYSYYPIILENEIKLLALIKKLKKNNIFPRRYFFPSLNMLNYTEKREMAISESISKRILCLPLYVSLSNNDLNRICNLISNI